MRLVHDGLGNGAVHAGHAHDQLHFNAKAGRNLAYASVALIEVSAGNATFCWPATNFIAPMKQAL